MSSGKSITQTARELGIKAPTLYQWLDQAKKQTDTKVDSDSILKNSQLIEELNRLRKKTSA